MPSERILLASATASWPVFFKGTFSYLSMNLFSVILSILASLAAARIDFPSLTSLVALSRTSVVAPLLVLALIYTRHDVHSIMIQMQNLDLIFKTAESTASIHSKNNPVTVIDYANPNHNHNHNPNLTNANGVDSARLLPPRTGL